MFKSERRKHVVGRGVLTRKDMAILMRDRNTSNDQSILKQRSEKVDCEIEHQTAENSKHSVLPKEPHASTSGFFI